MSTGELLPQQTNNDTEKESRKINTKTKLGLFLGGLAVAGLAFGVAKAAGGSENSSATPQTPTSEGQLSPDNSEPLNEDTGETSNYSEIAQEIGTMEKTYPAKFTDTKEWVKALEQAQTNPLESAQILSSVGVGKVHIDILQATSGEACAISNYKEVVSKLRGPVACGGDLADAIINSGVYDNLPDTGFSSGETSSSVLDALDGFSQATIDENGIESLETSLRGTYGIIDWVGDELPVGETIDTGYGVVNANDIKTLEEIATLKLAGAKKAIEIYNSYQ